MKNTRLYKQSFFPLYRFLPVLLIPICLLFSGCGNHNENIPDVSGIKINLQTYRFDKDLFAIDTNHIGEGLQKLSAKYPDFLNYFLDTIMAYGIRENFADTTQGVQRTGYLSYL